MSESAYDPFGPEATYEPSPPPRADETAADGPEGGATPATAPSPAGEEKGPETAPQAAPKGRRRSAAKRS